MTHKGEKVALKLLLFISGLLYTLVKCSANLDPNTWFKLDNALESLTNEVNLATGESNESN